MEKKVKYEREEASKEYFRVAYLNDPLVCGFLQFSPAVVAALSQVRTLTYMYFHPSRVNVEKTYNPDISHWKNRQKRPELERQMSFLAQAVAELIKANQTAMPTRYMPTKLLGKGPRHQLAALAALSQLHGKRPRAPVS